MFISCSLPLDSLLKRANVLTNCRKLIDSTDMLESRLNINLHGLVCEHCLSKLQHIHKEITEFWCHIYLPCLWSVLHVVFLLPIGQTKSNFRVLSHVTCTCMLNDWLAHWCTMSCDTFTTQKSIVKSRLQKWLLTQGFSFNGRESYSSMITRQELLVHTYSSVKKASIIRVPNGLTANSGMSIRSWRLRVYVWVQVQWVG